MFFSRIKMNTDFIKVQDLTHLLRQDSYQDHQMVWRFFPHRPDANRDFLFRKEQINGWPCFYVVSALEPIDPSGLWHIETKSYQPKLRQGQQLAFDVRVNPVVTRWVGEGENRRQVRHDVVMDAKKSLTFDTTPTADQLYGPELIQDAGLKWILSRCQRWGFLVTEHAIRVDGYRQQRVFKRGRKSAIRFSTLDYTGLLTVDDPTLFSETLFQGIGKSRGLGCGLLLVKPTSN